MLPQPGLDRAWDGVPNAYPYGFRDPVWDGSVAGFGTVLAARAETVSETLGAGLPGGLRFVFVAVADGVD